MKGALDKDQIRTVVRANLNAIKACYNAGLARDPDLRGRVGVQFTIGPTGAVTAAVVLDTEVADRAVVECLLAEARRWTFPKPKGGSIVVVTYPFVLETD